MMADVACFCGCCFSFDGGAGACPRCGEVARVTAGPVPDHAALLAGRPIDATFAEAGAEAEAGAGAGRSYA